MHRILFEKLNLFYETIFDEKSMSILFSLCPEANQYFIEMLGRKSPMNNNLNSQQELSPFIFPTGEAWGFGGVFRLNNSKSIDDGWITWECMLPWKAMQNQLMDIAGSIQILTDILGIFGYDKKDEEIGSKLQFMTIDGMVVKSKDYMHGGEFNFSYARPVLEFCEKIWSNKKIYDEIVNAMQKTWLYLLGEKKIRSYDRGSFRVSTCQDDQRLISLVCPGNCA